MLQPELREYGATVTETTDTSSRPEGPGGRERHHRRAPTRRRGPARPRAAPGSSSAGPTAPPRVGGSIDAGGERCAPDDSRPARAARAYRRPVGRGRPRSAAGLLQGRTRCGGSGGSGGRRVSRRTEGGGPPGGAGGAGTGGARPPCGTGGARPPCGTGGARPSVPGREAQAPPCGTGRGGVRGGHSDRDRATPDRPGVPVPHRARPGRRGPRRPLPADGSGSSPRGCRSSCGAASRTRSSSASRSGAGSPIAACSRRRYGACWPMPARRPSSTTSPASGCRCAASRASRPTPTSFPASTRTCGWRSGARPSCSSRASSREDRSVVELLSADYTFLNERLARHYGIPGVTGKPLPAGVPRRQGTGGGPSPRPPRPRQHPRRDLLRQPHVAGAPGEVAARERAGDAAGPAPARHPAPARRGRGGRAAHGPRAARATPGEPRLRRLPRADGPAGLRPRELRRHRPVADQRRRVSRRRLGRARRRASPRSTAPAGCGGCCSTARGSSWKRWPRSSSSMPSDAASSSTIDRSSAASCARAAADDHRWSSVIMGIVESAPFRMRRPES